jgi:hypothetical protein
MAELVDALGSGPSGGNTVEVRVLFWAPFIISRQSAASSILIIKSAQFFGSGNALGNQSNTPDYSRQHEHDEVGTDQRCQAAFRKANGKRTEWATFDPIVVIQAGNPQHRSHAKQKNEYTNLRIRHDYSLAAEQIIDSCKILQLSVKLNPLSYNAILHVKQ